MLEPMRAPILHAIVGASVLIALAATTVCVRRGLPQEQCEAFVDAYARIYGEAVGPSYAERLATNRASVISTCQRHGTPELVRCVEQATSTDELYACGRANLRPAPPDELGRSPSPEQCERQATWRIELHDEVELPSIAKGIAQTRGSMVSTCMQHWSEPYVSCLEGAPSLGFAEACDSVGRVRKP